MTHDIQREILRKNDDKYVQDLIRERMRDPLMAPFEVQLLDRSYRPFRHMITDAQRRGDDINRVITSIAGFSADMTLDLIMKTLSPRDPDACYRVAQSIMEATAQAINDGLHAYTAAPPAPAQRAPANDS